ncbi:MFS transporter [Clostridium saccharoperbutylacetonicum]|uniref:MFS transporter n=1 Tax=Clostridium saccharoperbutylacetonicum TaxID=36745 RepID=UPI0009839DEB|nr:MFS transporter [Clostridium saccharoperbutylacetonicum]AQR94821.1 multidrug efflux system protein MdtL [Clostridium saccharoperbutylacetonicum]NSB30662.1 MFS family permease [Clostridium saccharoperbutylacetonicum]
MKIELLKLNRANIVFIGLVIINICVSYLAGSTGIYAATAFREYGRLDLFNAMFILEPLARSLSLLISGRAGEYFGRKQLYMWSVGAFALSIAISSVATNGVTFLLARGASGFFWGLFFANVFTMINDIMSEEYPVRIGIMQTIYSLVLILGPILCGLLTESWNWRVSIAILLPLFVVGMLLVGCFMPKSKIRKKINVNIVKENSKTENLNEDRKNRRELLILQLLKQRGYGVIILITFITTCISCSGNYIPLYAQTVLGANTAISAIVLAPCNIFVMALSSAAGVYISKKGCTKTIFILMSGTIFIGTCIYVATLFISSYFVIILSTAIIGIGVGIHQVVPFAFAQRHLEDKLIAEGISFISFVQGVAGVIAGMIYSATMKNGIAFSLAFTVVYSFTLILITILKYKEPQVE